MEITIEIPDSLKQHIQSVQDRLPEILERGLQVVLAEAAVPLYDEQIILETLTSQPTPEQVLALTPSPAFQARVSDLLHRSKYGGLTHQEERELDRCLLLEHMVRLAKAHAYQQ